MIEFNTKANGAVPFWFWNGDQQEDEITRQLELAAAGGFKGLAIHARTGNQTEYMSERWIALTRHSCEEARRLGLEIWIYDEEGFPSGTVGHRLQKAEPHYQQKQLRFDYMAADEALKRDDLVAMYDAESFERIGSDGVGEVLAFHVERLERYVDTLQRDTTDRFMEMTHLKYLEELGEYFGNPITYVYTDDLNSNLASGSCLPYTGKLFERFKKQHDYDLLEHLPQLVENLPGSEKVRLDFRGTVLGLFLNEFVSPMHQWCEEQGVGFTGHLSGDEGDISKAVQRFGSAMAFYEHEHIPGIDDFLCSVSSGRYLDQLRNRMGHCPVVLFKQAASVANQLKSGICSCEVLTFLGWGVPMWGQSAFLNYELALGVNLMVHHDFSYATGRVAKRDCPPSYFFQQPYWPEYRLFHDAMARSTQLLTRGRYAADTLVIHPLGSCWAAMDGTSPFVRGRTPSRGFAPRLPSPYPHPTAFEDSLAAVSHELLKMHVGFEYGDEQLMARHARVDGGQLCVGKMAYSTVVIPRVCNLQSSTVELLGEFEKNGGTLIAVEPLDECLIDGESPSKTVFGEMLNPCVIDAPEGLKELGLRPTLELRTREKDAPVVVHSRSIDGAKEHFVYNVSDRDQTIEWDDELEVYDPTDNVCVVTTDRELMLPPFHAVHLLPTVPDDTSSRLVAETLFSRPAGNAAGIPADAWTITLDEPNLLLVDWCELPDGRAVYHTEKHDGIGDARLKAVVAVSDPAKVSGLMGEAVTLDTMTVNGEPLVGARSKHVSSQDMDIADVGGLLVAGDNVFEFDCLAGYTLFEPFYLMGDFGVDLVETSDGMRPRMIDLSLGFGDLVERGLPFYWGGICFEAELEGSDIKWLDCGDVDGVVTVHVNGERLACRYAAPYRFYVSDCPQSRVNRIVVTASNTAQNLYGPHRSKHSVDLEALEPRGNGDGDYYLAPFGLQGPVSVVT